MYLIVKDSFKYDDVCLGIVEYCRVLMWESGCYRYFEYYEVGKGDVIEGKMKRIVIDVLK